MNTSTQINTVPAPQVRQSKVSKCPHCGTEQITNIVIEKARCENCGEHYTATTPVQFGTLAGKASKEKPLTVRFASGYVGTFEIIERQERGSRVMGCREVGKGPARIGSYELVTVIEEGRAK